MLEKIARYLHEHVDYSHGDPRLPKQCEICRQHAADILLIVNEEQRSKSSAIEGSDAQQKTFRAPPVEDVGRFYRENRKGNNWNNYY